VRPAIALGEVSGTGRALYASTRAQANGGWNTLSRYIRIPLTPRLDFERPALFGF